MFIVSLVEDAGMAGFSFPSFFLFFFCVYSFIYLLGINLSLQRRPRSWLSSSRESSASNNCVPVESTFIIYHSRKDDWQFHWQSKQLVRVYRKTTKACHVNAARLHICGDIENNVFTLSKSVCDNSGNILQNYVTISYVTCHSAIMRYEVILLYWSNTSIE